jgi:hypothetical protein
LLMAGFVPQAAVFIDGFNEFVFPDGQPRYTDRFRRLMEGTPDLGLLDNVPVVKAAQWVRDHRTKSHPRKPMDSADPAVLEGVIARWLANKRMIELIAYGFGVRPIFVWQPVPIYKYDTRYHFLLNVAENRSGGFPLCQQGYALMENLRAQGKLGGDVLWLADMQQDKHENLYVDSMHYNAPFSGEIAAQICSSLRKHPQSRR